jgi:1,4-alpha-glucan branching enzyme
MTTLPQEAYAVIEGRHSDPFHYLGVHVEGDHPVVRAFVPDAEEVVAVDNDGHESELARVHEAGLFAGRLPNGSPRYHLRARFGERVVEFQDSGRAITSTSITSSVRTQ